MADPVVALAVFGALVVVLALSFWPRWGLVPRFIRGSRSDERVRLEDALKHVFTCERNGRECTLESLAGRLEISTSQAAEILSRLSKLGLVRSDERSTSLTEEGTASAIRIVRTHRLWERYLADRTGVPAVDWHDHAERMEHALSPHEVDALEIRLGHPRWDPHGDPIPTASGEVPPVHGMTLLSAEPGRTVEILHLEDEPRAIYDQLLQNGLAPGGRLEVVETGHAGVMVRSGGREWTIDSVSARNVTVRALPDGERAAEPLESLADATLGETVCVVGISPTCQGIQRRRLLDLGVVPGTMIKAEMTSASGDPVAYLIRGALIALRHEQASWIHVTRAAVAEQEVT